MGKLMIKTHGGQADAVNLKLGEMTIGRSPSCEIVLDDDVSVSNRHAMIKTVGKKSTIEDLCSTNGTFIDNIRITRHELRHNETIVIGKYELHYRDVVELDTPTFGRSATAPTSPTRHMHEKTVIITAQAQLVGIEGKEMGKNVPLVKTETVLDNPGKNPARIYRTSDGYVLHAQAGPGEPRLNDRPVHPGGQLLENGDVLEVAGTKYQINI